MFGPFEFILAGVLVGFCVGITGVGGGSLMTPILISLFRIEPHIAIGTDLVADAGTTMDDLMSGVSNVAALMNEIMSSSQEQSLGIEQVNLAINQLDNSTQQNAALVEEAAAAAESMQEQAQLLAEAPLACVHAPVELRAWLEANA